MVGTQNVVFCAQLFYTDGDLSSDFILTRLLNMYNITSKI